MAAAGPSPESNHLLAALPARDCRRLVRAAEAQTLAPGDVLCEPGQAIDHVHFPLRGAAISDVQTLADGVQIEVFLVGAEGMAGVSVVLGDRTARLLTVVQAGGIALRLGADDLLAAAGPGTLLDRLARRYARFQLATAAQAAACHRFHTLAQRCCRWVLELHDRVGADDLGVTHDNLAKMLGVRRVGVTQTAQGLQRAGLIRYQWGRVTVLDRAGLEAAACECYRVVRDEYDRLLGPAAGG